MKKILPLLSLLSLVIITLIVGCTEQPELVEVKETREMMGTQVMITVYHENENISKAALDDAFFEIEIIDDILSSYNESSELSKLNKEKYLKNASGDMLINIINSVYYGRLSNGSFDITVQPVLDLYSYCFGDLERAPTEEEIESELEKVDYMKIIVSGESILIGKDQKITLGGIAKGYIVDRAIDILREHGIEHALVNAGGDLRAIAGKNLKQDWIIGLANPRDKSDVITVIKLNNKSVVTSGDYERYFEETKTFHHIVNPKTGYSSNELISVTIVADYAMDADALSTSVFVLGAEKGLELVESLEDVEGLIITAEKEIIKSSGFD